ncbi:MAG: glutamate formimidoyltransferase [Candidatus Bathyarchaeota archaeon]|nr:MAG: glutamate formimidoyltransferase [Candidatus Bathyarchaeota archaeon]
MRNIIEAVPNFSTSNPTVVKAILNELKKIANVYLLDYTYDDYYNRLVVSFVGNENSILQASLKMAAKGIELIDMNQHKGQHPRIGAVDVFPFIPLRHISIETCVRIAKKFGKSLAEKHQVPVYLYGMAAEPERSDLDWIRKGEYEALFEMIRKPERKPDYGPAVPHPTAGATITGARKVMAGFNVNLNTSDLKVAKKIARTLHAKKGGFATVKAMAASVPKKKITQIGMSITNFDQTPLYRVFEVLKLEAARHNVSIMSSEFCGMTPIKSLIDIAAYYLKIDNLSEDRVLEIAIQKAMEKDLQHDQRKSRLGN